MITEEWIWFKGPRNGKWMQMEMMAIIYRSISLRTVPTIHIVQEKAVGRGEGVLFLLPGAPQISDELSHNRCHDSAYSSDSIRMC